MYPTTAKTPSDHHGQHHDGGLSPPGSRAPARSPLHDQPPEATIPSLEALGWDPEWEARFTPFATLGLAPARVINFAYGRYRTLGPLGDRPGRLAGRLRRGFHDPADFPTVGDWVAIGGPPGTGQVMVHGLLPRRNVFKRIAPSNLDLGSAEQAVSANVDLLLILSGLDGNHNPRRLERFLLQARAADLPALLLLNKVDLGDPTAALEEVRAIAGTTPVLPISAQTGEGVADLAGRLAPASTTALVGSSGVGKSTLINRLLGRAERVTGEVRGPDSHGRHVTVDRALVALPNGALIVDNPGIRELAAIGSSQAIRETFADVEALARQCRYRDCTHSSEPGCAIRRAIHEGRLGPGRARNYRQLHAESSHWQRRKRQRKERGQRREAYKRRRRHGGREFDEEYPLD